jgi:hypothetical protein
MAKVIAALVFLFVMFASTPAFAFNFPMPGTVVAQTGSTARSHVDAPVFTIPARLDALYLPQCSRIFEVNAPRLYACGNTQILFTYGALTENTSLVVATVQ